MNLSACVHYLWMDLKVFADNMNNKPALFRTKTLQELTNLNMLFTFVLKLQCKPTLKTYTLKTRVKRDFKDITKKIVTKSVCGVFTGIIACCFLSYKNKKQKLMPMYSELHYVVCNGIVLIRRYSLFCGSYIS